MYHVFSTSVNQNVEQLINIIKFLHEKYVPFISTPGIIGPINTMFCYHLKAKLDKQTIQSIWFMKEQNINVMPWKNNKSMDCYVRIFITKLLCSLHAALA
jgi:hypothetical protein